MTDVFMELKNNDELYEFARQYHMDRESIEDMRFPIAVYFDKQTGKPSFRSATPPPYRILFYNEDEDYQFESEDLNEVLDFIRRKGRKKAKVNDFVYLENHLAVLPQMISFFQDSPYEYACRYAYGETPSPNKTYKVLEIKNKIALVEDVDSKKCYLSMTENLIYAG